MSWSKALRVVLANMARDRRAFLLCSFGLVVGIATFTFFVALGLGIQERVINRIYPVNQIEVEPATIGVMGLRQQVLSERALGQDMVEALSDLDNVTAVYPKIRSQLQARLWGGKALFGYDVRTEAFFDGLAPALLHPDLRASEGVETVRSPSEDQESCLNDHECPLGEACRLTGESTGLCHPIEYWQRFTDRGMVVPCDEAEPDSSCLSGQRCVRGTCQPACDADQACGEGERCLDSRCVEGCTQNAECGDAMRCVMSDAEATGYCEPIPCRLAQSRFQFSHRLEDTAGLVIDRCANGVAVGSPLCEPLPCPSGTYCAANAINLVEGFCQAPVPVVLSPFLIEVFNTSVASSLDLQPLDGTEALLGVRFRLHLGGSFFKGDLPTSKQAIVQTEIVGFSNKALDFGATMPIEYVRKINRRFRGGAGGTDSYGTFLLETEANEDVSRLIDDVEARGLTLSRKSRDARKAADMLLILTLVFSFISLVIMGVAAVNITHTFLMVVTERRHEIAIMRAVGASRWEIRRLILVESALIAVFGTVVGEAIGWAACQGANLAAARFLEGVPFKPDDFFIHDWRVLVGALGFALVFCLLGALIPANRAAGVDPARVLGS